MSDAFADRWSRKERECGFGDIASNIVACGADMLPESAVPFVTFKQALRPVPIWEAFASPSDWLPADRQRLTPYRMIGSDGAGNPICVDQGTGVVVLFDHEDWFRTQQFVNSSVHQLAECLLAYMGEQPPERFREMVLDIDPPPMAENFFWWCAATELGT